MRGAGAALLLGAALVAAPQAALATADLEQAALDRLGVADAEFLALELPGSAVACDVELSLGGATRTLRLWPHEVRARSFRLVAADGPVETVLPTPPAVTVRGAVLGSAGSVVAGALVDGTFEGLVRFQERLFGVQPTPELGVGFHAVYDSGQLLPEEGTCGNADGPGSVASFVERVRRVSGSLSFLTELAVDCDYEFYQLNGGSTTSTQNDVTNVLNAMDGIYGSQIQIDHVITTIIVRTTSSDPYGSSVPSSLLNQFANHWANFQQGVQRDAAHLFTGKNLQGSTIGIANPSSVCSANGYALSQSRFSGNFNRRVALTAHEVGHTMNAYHCNQQSTCRIMCSAIAQCGSITSFAPTSVNSITYFRNQADCIVASAPPDLSGVAPASLEALDGDELLLTGCHFSSALSVNVGGEVLPISSPRITVVGDGVMTLVPGTQNQLGSLDVFVTGPGGDSPVQTVQVDVTSPPRLIIKNDSFGSFPVEMDWGGTPGDSYLAFYKLNDGTTFPYAGWDLLLDAQYSGYTGVLDAAGLGELEVVVPPFTLIYQTLFVQVAFFGPGGFAGVTPVESTYFQI